MKNVFVRFLPLLLLIAACSEHLYAAGGDFIPDYVGGGASYNEEAHEAAYVETGWQVNPDWQISARFEQGSYNGKHTVSLVEFNESFEHNSFGLFVERRIPFIRGLKAIAGVVHSDKTSSWVSAPQSGAVYEINGIYYSGLNLGQPQATVSYEPVTPYAGLAWSSLNPGKRGWGVSIEVGALFNSDPEVTIKADNTVGLSAASAALLDAGLLNDVNEYVEQLRNENEFFSEVSPRASVSVVYQF